MDEKKIFHAFTDGSCVPNPGKGGWGWVFYVHFNDSTTIRFKHSGCKKNSTNNEMELTAMLECFQSLSKRNKPYKVIIHSDSEYVLKGLVDGGNGLVGTHVRGRCHGWGLNDWKTKKGERANKLLWQKTCQECKRCYKDGIELELKWVKGHSGSEGNDLADTLAKEAREKQ